MLLRSFGGFIYAVKEHDAPLVKIGHTRGPIQKRLLRLQREYGTILMLVGEVFVIEDVYHVEQHLHAIFAAEHLEKEWFYTHINQVMLERVVDLARRQRAAFVAEKRCQYEEEQAQRKSRHEQILLRKHEKKIKQQYIRQLGTLAYQVISGIERGVQDVHAQRLARLAAALGVSSDYLLGLSEQEAHQPPLSSDTCG